MFGLRIPRSFTLSYILVLGFSHCIGTSLCSSALFLEGSSGLLALVLEPLVSVNIFGIVSVVFSTVWYPLSPIMEWLVFLLDWIQMPSIVALERGLVCVL